MLLAAVLADHGLVGRVDGLREGRRDRRGPAGRHPQSAGLLGDEEVPGGPGPGEAGHVGVLRGRDAVADHQHGAGTGRCVGGDGRRVLVAVVPDAPVTARGDPGRGLLGVVVALARRLGAADLAVAVHADRPAAALAGPAIGWVGSSVAGRGGDSSTAFPTGTRVRRRPRREPRRVGRRQRRPAGLAEDSVAATSAPQFGQVITVEGVPVGAVGGGLVMSGSTFARRWPGRPARTVPARVGGPGQRPVRRLQPVAQGSVVGPVRTDLDLRVRSCGPRRVSAPAPGSPPSARPAPCGSSRTPSMLVIACGEHRQAPPDSYRCRARSRRDSVNLPDSSSAPGRAPGRPGGTSPRPARIRARPKAAGAT